MAHSYWRLYITRNAGSAYVGCREFELHTTVGGSQAATGGTALESSHYASEVAANAFDGTTTTTWSSSGSALPQYLGYQFASAVDIVEFSITAGGLSNENIRSFYLQYSDNGSDWTSVGYFTDVELTGVTPITYQIGIISGNIEETSGITKWRITAVKCSDGSFVGSTTSTGTTYSLYIITRDVCNITCSPHIDRYWKTGITPQLGEFWVPSDPDATPRLYECTTSGAVGASEPTWPVSGTVNDGSAVWTFVSNLFDPITLGPKLPT